MKRIFIFIFLIVFIGFQGCLEYYTCNQLRESGLIFNVKYTGKETPSRLIFAADNVKMDTLWNSKEGNISLLPLELNDTTTRFLFFHASASSSVIIYHSFPDPEFHGVNCGITPKYEIHNIEFTPSPIDSIVIINKIVSNDLANPNITVYYH